MNPKFATLIGLSGIFQMTVFKLNARVEPSSLWFVLVIWNLYLPVKYDFKLGYSNELQLWKQSSCRQVQNEVCRNY